MGYLTEFTGHVTITPPLNAHEVAYLRKFTETRRMDRDNGPYYVDGTGFMGQGGDADIRDYNSPPAGQPGLWCHWTPTEDGARIKWNGQQKFYDAMSWMQYLIDHFLRPGGQAQGHPGFEQFTFDHVVNGEIAVQGEDPDDQWWLVVEDNKM